MGFELDSSGEYDHRHPWKNVAANFPSHQLNPAPAPEWGSAKL